MGALKPCFRRCRIHHKGLVTSAGDHCKATNDCSRPAARMQPRSTGAYRKPIYAILQGSFEIVVANAQHVKKARGCKIECARRRVLRWLLGLEGKGLTYLLVPALSNNRKGLLTRCSGRTNALGIGSRAVGYLVRGKWLRNIWLSRWQAVLSQLCYSSSQHMERNFSRPDGIR
jgi:hypothetical protein